jgi:hypothetical protein
MMLRRVSALLALGVFWVAAASAAPILYVATNGNDAWSGALPAPNDAKTDGPFASLPKAQEALRALGGPEGLPEGAVVYVREGTYFLKDTLRFGPQDSGTPAKPVRWEAYRKESVRLVGGQRVEGWEPYRDAIMKTAAPNLKQCRHLFFNGDRQTIARWPNKDADGLPGGGWTFTGGPVESAPNRSFHYLGDRPSHWASNPGIEVYLWPHYNWFAAFAGVASIDAASKSVTLLDDLYQTIEPGRRFFFQNIFEELDAPGEYFYDEKTGTLYFWPPAAIDGAEVIAPTLDHALVVSHAKAMVFLGFTIEATKDDAVVVEDAEDCLLGRCCIRNTGARGVHITGGVRNKIAGNDIYQTGEGGVFVSGGDRKTLTPAHHIVVNNHIHHFASLRQTYHAGVDVEGVGNLVAHNSIHDGPQNGILLHGNDHIVEYNEIHHLCMDSSDAGAFYMGRDWTERGNIFRFNKIHDIYGFGLASEKDGVYRYEAPFEAWGVYLDDCASGVAVYGNLIYRVPLGAIIIGGGRDNLVEDNYIVGSSPALFINMRWDEFSWDAMQQNLDAMNAQNPPYSTRYPEILSLANEPRVPVNNRFIHNLVAYDSDDMRGIDSIAPAPGQAVVYDFAPFDPATTQIDENVIWHNDLPIRVGFESYRAQGKSVLTWDQWKANGFDGKTHFVKPAFIDPQDDDYEIPASDPLVTSKLKPLPIARMGLYHDELRASWPVPNDPRRQLMKQHVIEVNLAALQDGALPPNSLGEPIDTANEQPAAAQTPNKALVLRLDAQGNYSVDQHPVHDNDLKAAVPGGASAYPDGAVIEAEAATPMEKIMEATFALKALGFINANVIRDGDAPAPPPAAVNPAPAP